VPAPSPRAPLPWARSSFDALDPSPPSRRPPSARVLLDPQPRSAFPGDRVAALHHLAALAAHERAPLAALPPGDPLRGPAPPPESLSRSSRAGAAGAAAILAADPCKLIPGLKLRPLPGGAAAAAAARAPGPLAGGALAHAGGPGLPLLLADDAFCHYTGTPCGAAPGAGLLPLLGVTPGAAARAAAAARAGAGFELCACVPLPEFRGSVHLKLTLRPVAPPAPEPAPGGRLAGAPPPRLIGGMVLVWADLVDASDPGLWTRAGVPLDFRLLASSQVAL
jgi:hypothetical protein